MASAAKIREHGNGFPGAGAYVIGHDANYLYRIVSVGDVIHTDRPDRDNYVWAEVEHADWSDCADADVFPASVEVVR